MNTPVVGLRWEPAPYRSYAQRHNIIADVHGDRPANPYNKGRWSVIRKVDTADPKRLIFVLRFNGTQVGPDFDTVDAAKRHAEGLST